MEEQNCENVIVHPIDASLLPENVTILPRKGGGWSYIIGTAHVSQVSSDHVKDVILAVKPDTVVVELCRSRVGMILQQNKVKKLNSSQNISLIYSNKGTKSK